MYKNINDKRAAGRRDYKKHRDKRKAVSLKYKNNHPEQVQAYEKKNRYARRSNFLRRKTGITLEEFESLVILQKSLCNICGEYANLVADHNHATNIFRGAICGMCNRGLGMFKDDSNRLWAAIKYLQGKF